jgi:hypothetical protein
VIRRISVTLLSLALAGAVSAREEYSRAFDKTVPLPSGARVYIENKFGDVVVRTHAQPQVTIHADIRVSASSGEQAKSFGNRVEIVVEPGASELMVRTRYPETSGLFSGFHNISYCVRYEIAIPETAPLNVRNSFGKVSAAGVKASSEIATSHGDLEFSDGRGAQRLEDSFANIRVAGNVGDVNVENSNGGVDVADVKGALTVRDRFANVAVRGVAKGVTIVNSNGTVQVNDSGGTGDIKNSFGDVTVQSFHCDLTVNNTNGKVEAAHIAGGAELNTTFGSVRLSDVSRQAAVRANNSAIEGSKIGGPLTVQNSFGSVAVSDVQGPVTIQSGNGNVSAANIRGNANVRTSYATAEATDVAGFVTVQDSNGSVKVSNARGAQVNTSFAGVILDGIAGALTVEDQNGAVDATLAAHGGCQPVNIKTSFSPLRLHIDGEASYRVTARTSFGKIRSDFPLIVSGSLSDDAVNGTIGSGRCELRLNNINGNVEILKGGS